MKKTSRIAAVALATLLVLVLMGEVSVSVSAAVTCNPTELSSCMISIISPAPPSKLCCSKIKEQKPCLCGYLRDPHFKDLVNSPNARKVATTCGTPYPKC